MLESLGHIDDQLHAVAVLLQDYSRDGAFDLREEVEGSLIRVIIERVKPIPADVSRGVADILNALRNLLGHVVYAEVQRALGRPLDEAESRAREMPVTDTSPNFDKWLNHEWHRDLPLLGSDGILTQKLRALQPFEWTGVERPFLGSLPTTRTRRSIGSPPRSRSWWGRWSRTTTSPVSACFRLSVSRRRSVTSSLRPRAVLVWSRCVAAHRDPAYNFRLASPGAGPSTPRAVGSSD